MSSFDNLETVSLDYDDLPEVDTEVKNELDNLQTDTNIKEITIPDVPTVEKPSLFPDAIDSEF